MKTRILSGIVMVPLILFLYLGGYPLMLIAAALSVIAVNEFFNGFGEMGVHASKGIAYASIGTLYAITIYMYYMGDFDYSVVLMWLTAFIMIASCSMFNIKRIEPCDAMATIAGIAYIIFFIYHIVMIDQKLEYQVFRWLPILTAFGSDIFAYFTGIAIGKHKMCPELSPNKTWEGAVGGIIGSAALSAIFGYLFAKEYLIHFIVIGILASPVSMLGDLTASAYKRHMGIKDYGKIIPGHGGIMDRFDSVIFTAPFVYYYVVIVMDYLMGVWD